MGRTGPPRGRSQARPERSGGLRKPPGDPRDGHKATPGGSKNLPVHAGEHTEGHRCPTGHSRDAEGRPGTPTASPNDQNSVNPWFLKVFHKRSGASPVPLRRLRARANEAPGDPPPPPGSSRRCPREPMAPPWGAGGPMAPPWGVRRPPVPGRSDP